MCCLRVETDVLLANIMNSKNYNGVELTVYDLGNCVRYIANRMPGYLDSDVSSDRVGEIATMYPELFEYDGVFVKRGQYLPRIEFFNQKYPEHIIERICAIINDFLINYKGQTVLLSTPLKK